MSFRITGLPAAHFAPLFDLSDEDLAARGAMRTYAHLAPKDDPFRRKAEAALWEWESGSK